MTGARWHRGIFLNCVNHDLEIVFVFICCTVSHSQANLNDSHNQMVVHWAGEKSDVIVALARDSVGATDPKTSSVSMHIVSFL